MRELNELAFRRLDAIDKCNELGAKFIEHFDKIYKEQGQSLVHHHACEMQAWFDTARKITLKSTNKPLSITELIDWFLTVGDTPESFLREDLEVSAYEDFYVNLLINKSVIDSLKVIGLYSDNE